MFNSIVRLLFLILFALSAMATAGAQEEDPQTPVNPEVVEEETEVALAVVGEVPSIQPVLSTCAVHPDNVCIAPTQGYLDELGAQNLPDAEYSQALADLVIALVPLVPSGEECGLVSSEVPASIRLVAAEATDPDQAARFIALATTLEACTDFQTAAIAPQASPN